MRLRLTLAYDGGGFSGWQSQPDGKAVQDKMEAAFAALCGERVVVHGAGRTDAGVHALAQSAHVDVPDSRLPQESWLPALNAHLPPTVRVMKLAVCRESFHARFSARGKIYRYSICNAPVMDPLLLGRAWHVPRELCLPRLREACEIFSGRHDFAAFSANRGGKTSSTVRLVSRVRASGKGSRLEILFEGEGFLYKMVRMLAASAVRCAAGRLEPAEIRRLLAEGGPRSSHVAPACGLCLVRVVY